MKLIARLDVWDYVVCASVLLLTSLLGIYHTIQARKAKNARSFLVSDSQIGFVPIVMSLIATYVSAIGVLGFPADTYTYGIVFASLAFASMLVIPFGYFIFMPIYCHINGGTLFEFLELRFNRKIRIICSIALNLKTILYSSIAIYAPSLAISQATGLHTWLSVALIAAICIVYTSLGGIKAVIWADATQLLVIVLILVFVVVKGVLDAGGAAAVYNINIEGGRLDLSRNDLYYTWWCILLGYPFHQLGPTLTNQSMVQRYMSKPTFKENFRLFLSSIFGVNFIQFFMASLGFLIYAKYSSCDPLYNEEVSSRDQILVLYAMQTLKFGKGLPGLFVAGILCASLSTLSSTLNALAAVTIEDYILPFKKNLQQSTVIKLSKIIAILYGAVSVLFVILVQSLGGIIQAVFCITGMIHGPVVGVITIGMLMPWVNSKGITVGLVAATFVTSWAAIGSMIHKTRPNHLPYSIDGCNATTLTINSTVVQQHNSLDNSFNFYGIHSIWYTSWSVFIIGFIGIVYPLLFGPQKDIEKMDPEIIAKCSRKIIASFPKSWKNKLGLANVDTYRWFGIETAQEMKSLKTNGTANGNYNVVKQEEVISSENT